MPLVSGRLGGLDGESDIEGCGEAVGGALLSVSPPMPKDPHPGRPPNAAEF
jgi:hypothetical protein